jgi:hypothetical protein
VDALELDPIVASGRTNAEAVGSSEEENEKHGMGIFV